MNSYFDASGHKIGSYAEFTQTDPRDYDCEKRADVQLLQIDPDEQIMFGDAGLGHFKYSWDGDNLKLENDLQVKRRTIRCDSLSCDL